MPRFNGINFYQSRPKIELFLPKKKYIKSFWGFAPKTFDVFLMYFDRWGFAPKTFDVF